jgi:HlyD family secretion protein
VTIDPAQLRAARLDLRSGMPAETHIETTSRSLLSYMFKPLRDQFARAFTDN